MERITTYTMEFDGEWKETILKNKDGTYSYSQQFIEFIITEIEKSPHNFVESLRKTK